MNKQQTKHILAITGIIITIMGIIGAIPSFLTGRYDVAIGSAVCVVFGLVLLAVSY